MDEVNREVQKSLLEEQPCILCGRQADSRALYTPSKGSVPTKSATGEAFKVIYSICSNHPNVTEATERVEKIIDQEFHRYREGGMSDVLPPTLHFGRGFLPH